MRLENCLARHMAERGFTDVQLAAHCGMDQAHLNRLKNGQVRPLLSTAFRISGALGLRVGEIFRLACDAAPPHRALRGARVSRASGRYRAARRR